MARSKLAVWSFVLILFAYFLILISILLALTSTSDMGASILVLYTILIGGIISIFALIMGIISIININKKRIKGKGFAIATIILSSLIILYSLYLIYSFIW